MLSLSQMTVGDSGRVVSMTGMGRAHRHQLGVLGLKKAKVVTLKQVSPLGDPFCFEVDGGTIVLRKHECEGILVERI